MPAVAPERITRLNACGPREDGRYVLYWMVANRRTRWNHALEHAIHTANAHGVGLIVLEALRCGYRWASDRMHRFVLDGMIDNGRALEAAGVKSLRYVEPEAGAGRGEHAERAAVGRLIDGERVARVDERPGHEVEGLLAAGGHEQVVRAARHAVVAELRGEQLADALGTHGLLLAPRGRRHQRDAAEGVDLFGTGVQDRRHVRHPHHARRRRHAVQQHQVGAAGRGDNHQQGQADRVGETEEHGRG